MIPTESPDSASLLNSLKPFTASRRSSTSEVYDSIDFNPVSSLAPSQSPLALPNGNLAVGAIASLVDEIGATVIYEKDVPMNVSVDMSISYLSTAKLNDELEISGKLLGIKGGYHGTLVVLKKKATGEIIAKVHF